MRTSARGVLPAENRGTDTDAFRRWLSSRSDDELSDLLARRPDLTVPPPADTEVLAGRARQRASVHRAVDDLTVAEFAVLAALAESGAVAEPVPVESVRATLSGRMPDDTLDAALDHLTAAALVWGDDALTVVPAAVETVPWRIGRLPDPAAMPADIDAAVAELPPDQRRVLTTLARTSPLGRTDDAAPGTAPDNPVQRLIAAGLLAVVDDSTVELPHAVGQAVRGEARFDPDTLTPPASFHHGYDPGVVDATGAGAVLDLLRRVDDLVTVLGRTPAPVLRAGGLGIRELRRLAKATTLDEAEAALLIEVLRAAGLVGRGRPGTLGPDDLDDYWAPSTAVDEWAAASTGERWAVLAGAWLRMPRRAWLVGARDHADKPVSALSEDLGAFEVVAQRRLVLDLLGSVSGAAPDTATLASVVTWHRPRWAGRLGSVVDATIREATVLGIVALGALTSAGRALLADTAPADTTPADTVTTSSDSDSRDGGGTTADAAAVLTTSLPEPVDHVLVQADLTVVAPGPLVPELDDAIRRMASVESAGAATVFRIDETSIRRALDSGATASDLHDLLTTRSRTPVPQALTYLIDDVARRHGLLRAGVATAFVRADDPVLLSELLAASVAADVRLRAIAPTVAVTDASLGEVLTRLRAAGFAPVGEDAAGGIVDLETGGARVAPARTRGYQGPVPVSSDQRTGLVRAMRRADRVATGPDLPPGTGGSTTMAVLRLAIDRGRAVRIGYADRTGRAHRTIVWPLSVDAGTLTAQHGDENTRTSFLLHRITSVALVDPDDPDPDPEALRGAP